MRKLDNIRGPYAQKNRFMSASRCASPFPLPLTTFERYMLDDDWPDYPMVFPVEMTFAGEIDRLAFETAYTEAVQRHPLLHARLARVRGRGWCFVDGSDDVPPIDWGNDGAPIRFSAGEGIDLRREPGLRAWVRQGQGVSQFILQVHHACCDGVGAARFVGDLFTAYARRVASANSRFPEMPAIDPKHLENRGVIAVSYPEPVSTATAIWATICEATKWACRRPAPLAIPNQTTNGSSCEVANSPQSAQYPKIQSHCFDNAQTLQLRRAAAQLSVTVNDVLLCAMLEASKEWNERHARTSRDQWLQINMPMNLREPFCDQMSAANKMSYTFLTRRASEVGDTAALLASIHSETKAIRDWSLGLYFLGGLSVAQRVPGLCRWLAGRKRCFATAVLSNLGNLTRRFMTRLPRENGQIVIGNLRLVDFKATPPIRNLTHVAMLAFTYAGRLNVDLWCNPHKFPTVFGKNFLALYVQVVTRMLGQIAQNTQHGGR